MKKGILMLFSAAFLGFSQRAAAADPEPLTVVFLKAEAYQLLLSYAEPFFASENVKVKQLPNLAGPMYVLTSMGADVALSGTIPVLKTFEKGADVKVLASLASRNDLFGVSRFAPGAGEIKKVALSRAGGENSLYELAFLEHLGANPAAVEFIYEPSESARYAMLDTGKADFVMVTSRDIAAQVKQEGKYRLIPYWKTSARSDARILAVTTGPKLEAKGPELAKFIKALYAAVKSAAEEPEKARAFLREKYSYSPEAAAELQAYWAKEFRAKSFVPDAAMLGRAAAGLKENHRRKGAPRGKRSASGLVFTDYARKAIEAASR